MTKEEINKEIMRFIDSVDYVLELYKNNIEELENYCPILSLLPVEIEAFTDYNDFNNFSMQSFCRICHILAEAYHPGPYLNKEQIIDVFEREESDRYKLSIICRCPCGIHLEELGKLSLKRKALEIVLANYKKNSNLFRDIKEKE